MKRKTISGARAKIGEKSDGCNPAHNNRDYLPSNADPTRLHLNEYYVDGTKGVTIEQIYEKLFQKSYDEWLDKEHKKGRQMSAPEKYLDKIRNSKDNKREQYEIIWQIGDMKNTGWNSDRNDFEKARILLDEFAEYLLKLPEVEVVTPEKLADPNWQPSFDNGIIVTNMALHGDENTPQIHMDFVPYSRTKKRGQRIQNAYAAAFEGMGYPVEDVVLCDENTGEVLYKQDKDGNVVCDKNGEPEPLKRKVRFGSVDWIEVQKGWLQQRMLEKHAWDREFKGKNEFGNVTISKFIVEDNVRIIAEQEKTIEVLKADKQRFEQQAQETLQEYRSDASELRAELAELSEQVNDLKTIEAYELTAQKVQSGIAEYENEFERVLEVCQKLPNEADRNTIFSIFMNGLKAFTAQMNVFLQKLEAFENRFKAYFHNRPKESEQLHPALDALIGSAEKVKSEQQFSPGERSSRPVFGAGDRE